MKTASIYYRTGKDYLIFGSNLSYSGFIIASDPFINIQENDSNIDKIVNGIKLALLVDNKERVPDPKDWSEFNKIILQKIGLKSIKELDNPNTKLVSISENKGVVTFQPTQPAKRPDKGFIYKSENEAVTTLITASNQEIGTAYGLALSRCS